MAAANPRPVRGKTRRLAAAKFTPPSWFGWLGVAAMVLLPVVGINAAKGKWFFPLLSLGEWLLLPLGAASLSMGLLTLWKVRERTLLPLWISAIIPALLWMAAVGIATLCNPCTASSGDMFLSWAVHLVFPTMAFLPLLSRPEWRDRLMWGLAAGLALNIAVIAWQWKSAGLPADSLGLLNLGGLLVNQHDYAVFLAVALPLLAAWRGGDADKYRALSILICTFLLPAVALTVCFGLPGLAAAAIGLAICLATWRNIAWIMGIFLCLLIFGYGSASRTETDAARRRLIAASPMGQEAYGKAMRTFLEHPYLGSGPESFGGAEGNGNGARPVDALNPRPWYATLLGGSGLIGLGMWLVLLGELAARALGRYGKRCLWYGGVLGGTIGLAAAGLWVDALPEGVGALVGILIAVSTLEEPAAPPAPRRVRKRKRVNAMDDLKPVAPDAPAPEAPTYEDIP